MLSKSSREQESCTTTVVFVPASDTTLGIPLEHQADAWRWSVKLGTQGDLGTPAQFIGAKLLGIIIREVKKRKGDYSASEGESDDDRKPKKKKSDPFKASKSKK